MKYEETLKVHNLASKLYDLARRVRTLKGHDPETEPCDFNASNMTRTEVGICYRELGYSNYWEVLMPIPEEVKRTLINNTEIEIEAVKKELRELGIEDVESILTFKDGE